MQTISIVIPVYNRAHIVMRTLSSVRAQRYRPLQVVLVDNDSDDNSLSLLENWARDNNETGFEVKVVSESRHTAGAARNRGAMCATGEWLMFFDSDDEMHPNLVGDYVEVIESGGGEADIVSTRATLRYTDGNERPLPFYTGDILGVQILNSQLATQRYVVRKTCFDSVGGWNADLPVWNDWELGMRLLLASPRVLFMPLDRVVVNHSGEASITGNGFSGKAGQWERVTDVVEEHLRVSGRTDSRRLLRLLYFKRVILAAQYQREGRDDLSVPLYGSAMDALTASYGDSLAWRVVIKPIVKALYSRIVAGKRGAAVIARRFL